MFSLPSGKFLRTFFLFWATPCFALAPPQVESEVVHQTQTSFQPEKFRHNRIWYLGSVTQPLSDTLNFSSSVLARADTQERFVNAEHEEVTLRKLTLGYNGNSLRLTVGLQEVTWGETFGVPVADIVNPRSVTEAWFVDSPAAKIPLAMVNLQLFVSSFDVQLIYVPLPRRSQLPRELNGVPLVPHKEPKWFRDSDGGIRAGGLLAGFDVHAFYDLHWNSLPVFDGNLTPEGKLVFTPFQKRVQTFGLSMSKAGDALVLRADSVYHKDMPTQSQFPELAQIHHLWQTVLGLDYTTSDASNVGLQYQFDFWDSKVEGLESTQYHWMGLRSSTNFFKRRLEPEFTAIMGIGTQAYWMKPKISGTLGSAVKLSVEGHFLRRGEPGMDLYFQNEKRLVTSINWHL